MRIVAVLSALLPMVLLTASGCGSGASQDAAAASVGVRVDPPTALVEPNGTVAFRATVTGTATTSVSWSVDCGSITQGGVFTAPQTNGTCRVTATSPASGVSGSAVVSVGAGGWAATCAAEPEPTTNVVYACDCQPGADANCVAGNDSNPGTKAQPYRSWSKVQAAWRALSAGGTLALCKGGRWAADTESSGVTSWLNTKCTPSAPCTMRDYSPTWGSGDEGAPVLANSAQVNVIDLWGSATDPSLRPAGGYRFLNLRLYRADGGASPSAGTAFRGVDVIPNVEVCNCDVDGFAFAFYVGGIQDGNACSASGWKIRGNRIVNSCTDAMLLSISSSEIDGNYFDNNGHALCGSYNLGNQTGGTTHTIYLDGGPAGAGCRVDSVRIANNEFHRNAVYQGYPQGSMLGVGARNARNVTYENNLIDWTPCHPTMSGATFVGGNAESPTTSGTDNVTIRRNRITHCSGRAVSFDSAPHALIEDNTIIALKPMENGLIYAPQGKGLNQTSAVIRNNTIYGTSSTSGGYAIWAADTTSAPGNIVTGNSVTFAGGAGAACFRVSNTALVSMMDNNQCSGATSYATTDGNTYYSLDQWRAATGFDGNSIAPAPTGLFVQAPSDLTPAVGSPLVGRASTLANCTVLGVANQPCSSTVAIGTPNWNPLEDAVTRSTAPSIGALDK